MLEKHFAINTPAHSVAGESRTLPDLFLRRVQASGERTAFLSKVNGQWVSTTWRRFYEQAAAVASYLLTQGIELGDKICMLGSTRAEWCICDMGGQLAGAVTLGAYPTLAPAQLAYILDHSDTCLVFVEGRAEVEKLIGLRDQLAKVKKVVVWNAAGLPPEWLRDGWVVPFEMVLATAIDRGAIDARIAAIQPDDTAIIVYTSGTTGPPKGAMIPHGNIISFLRANEDVIPLDADDLSFCFLPLAHVAERVAGFYGRIGSGIAAGFATSIPAVLEEIREVRPTFFGAVPRVFEKAYARIMSEVAKMPPLRQRLFRWAEATGRRVVRRWREGKPIPLGLRLRYKLVDRLVFSKIRQAFGGRVKNFATGAAPIAYDILEFFWAVGLPIYEVYGMTESTVISHANKPGHVRLGTVGPAIGCVEDRLAEDGEILIHGPTVFKGYYKNPEATAEAIDASGWLHTGDVGRRDADGFMRIVDRKKHIIITSGGKNITPSNIEQEIKSQDPLISQVHVHGDRRSYLTALVTIHPIEAVEWAKAHGLVDDPERARVLVAELMSNPFARPAGLGELMQRVTEHPELRARMIEAVRKANVNLSRVETIKKIYLLERDFSLEENEITPTLKVKRREVEKKFAGLFDRLYAEPAFGLPVSDGDQYSSA